MKRLLLFLSLISLNFSIAQDFWTEVAPFDNAIYFPKQISIVDENVVWVNGVTNDISNPNKWSKSIDGGLTWVSGEYNIPNSIIGSLHSISNNVAFATSILTDYNNPNPTGINGVWKTTDGGLTWVHQTTATFNNTDSFVNTIHFWNENHGIVLGDPVNNSFEIYTSLNGGTNWTQVPAANIPNALTNEVGFVLNFDIKGNSVWFGTSKGRIFRSFDNGLNWSVSQSPVVNFDGENGADFSFKNENEGLLITKNWHQYRTLNGGVTWNYELVFANVRNFETIAIPETTNAYFQFGEESITAMRGSSYSIDGGQNWISLDETEINPVMPYTAKFLNGTVGFCIGYYIMDSSLPGIRFFKLTDPLNRLNGSPLSTSSKKISNYSISPNPSSGIVKVYGDNFNKISITDISGKTIFEECYSNINEISIDISNFQNGIYIAKVKSETDSVSTIKIIKE